MKIFAIILLLASAAYAQGTIQIEGSGVPSGQCNGVSVYRDRTTGELYDCVSSVWHDTGSSLTPSTTAANPANMSQDATHRFVTDAQITAWNSAAGGGVPTTRTVNAHPLSADVVVSASDLTTGTLPCPQHPALTGDVTTTGCAATIGASKVTNAMLAGSIDASTKFVNVVPFANGGNQGAAATPASTGSMSVSMTTSVVTITPSGACTFNATGGVAGETTTFVVTTSGTTSFVLTWGMNYKTTATLATGIVSAKTFAITFRCSNGTTWVEISRTAAMT